MKTYHVIHAIGITSSSYPDAQAICDRVNRITESNGDSISKNAVQAELDNCASPETQETYGITVYSEDQPRE